MMEAATTPKLLTADEFWELCGDRRLELVRGEVVEMAPAGEEHGGVGTELVLTLGGFVREHRLGRVLALETGYLVRREPDTIRAPDAAFIRAARLPRRWSTKYSRIVPDLVLEVVSPSDTESDVVDKVYDWLAAGVLAVLLLRPRQEELVVYRSRTDLVVLTRDGTLTIEDLLPGFSLALADLFPLDDEEEGTDR